MSNEDPEKGSRRRRRAAAASPPASGSSERLLVQCPDCRRQYDATGRAPGTRFRCHCGRQVEVQPPRGHDAEVVRCSGCGAPRESGASRCGFCHSDFTLHELDLNTVCPACLARVSRKARFCHHCGTSLTAELVAGTASEHTCPICDSETPLVSRRLVVEEITVLECPRCVGLWVGLESMYVLLAGEPRAGGKASPNHVPEQRLTAHGYRPCVVCRELMTRRNFGFSQSGVIIDICGRHGVWFDADELTQVLAWVRSGGLEAARDDLARLRGSPDKVRRRTVQNRDQGQTVRPPTPSTIDLRVGDSDDRGLGTLLGGALEAVPSVAEVLAWIITKI